jgi:hypothetical protein
MFQIGPPKFSEFTGLVPKSFRSVPERVHFVSGTSRIGPKPFWNRKCPGKYAVKFQTRFHWKCPVFRDPSLQSHRLIPQLDVHWLEPVERKDPFPETPGYWLKFFWSLQDWAQYPSGEFRNRPLKIPEFSGISPNSFRNFSGLVFKNFLKISDFFIFRKKRRKLKLVVRGVRMVQKVNAWAQGSYLRLDLLEWWRNGHFPEICWGYSVKVPEGFGEWSGKFRKKTGRNSLIFWNFDVFGPKMAIFPNQNTTNPDFFGIFLRWIQNAPEVKCRKIRPLPEPITRRVLRILPVCISSAGPGLGLFRFSAVDT